MDGMDQKKTNIPILFSKSRNSKHIANLQQIRTHLLGVLVHRESGYLLAKSFGIFMPPEIMNKKHLVFSSPELKAQVSYSDCWLSVVRPFVNFYIIYFFSRTTGPILTRLCTDHSLGEGFQVC
jgi:hypothetical protein